MLVEMEVLAVRKKILFFLVQGFILDLSRLQSCIGRIFTVRFHSRSSTCSVSQESLEVLQIAGRCRFPVR